MPGVFRGFTPIRRCVLWLVLLAGVVADCGCGAPPRLQSDAATVAWRSARRVAYGRPVVSRTSISYVNAEAMRGYQENENDGTETALWREYRLCLREQKPDWTVLDSVLTGRLHRRLAGFADTLRGLDSATWAALAGRSVDYCVVVYDVRLMHSQAVYAGRYGGLGYGARISRSLFLRYAVLDIMARRVTMYGELQCRASDARLGLMEKAVKRLLRELTG